MNSTEYYQYYTANSQSSQTLNKKVSGYIEAAKRLADQEILRSIGYDEENIENFLFFSQKLTGPQFNIDSDITEDLQHVLKFNWQRQRPWRILYIQGEQDNEGARRFINAEFLQLAPGSQISDNIYFLGVEVIYFEPGYFSNFFGHLRTDYHVSYFKNIQAYVKSKKSGDLGFCHSLLNGLPSLYIQKFLEERSLNPATEEDLRNYQNAQIENGRSLY